MRQDFLYRSERFSFHGGDNVPPLLRSLERPFQSHLVWPALGDNSDHVMDDSVDLVIRDLSDPSHAAKTFPGPERAAQSYFERAHSRRKRSWRPR